MMNVTGWSRNLEVSGDGTGVVSHAGLALVRHLADKTASPLTSTNPPQRSRKETQGPRNPRPPGPPAGPLSYPRTKIRVQNAARRSASASHQPR